MQTILVPTDFSSTAANAAHYAFRFAKQTGAKKIVLYNVYQMPVAVIDPMLPNLQVFNLEDQKKLNETEMETFSKEFRDKYAGEDISLETICEFNILTDGIDDVVEKTRANIVVMGITGGDELDELLIGSNAISVAKSTKIPVIIVPPHCQFKVIEKIMLSSDFVRIEQSTPVEPIKALLDATNAHLMVLNIRNKKIDEKQRPAETLIFDSLLDGYDPSYYFLQSAKFMSSIKNFAIEHKVDMIMIIPKKHGWFQSLFKRSHTSMLAFHSDLPLVVIHE